MLRPNPQSSLLFKSRSDGVIVFDMHSSNVAFPHVRIAMRLWIPQGPFLGLLCTLMPLALSEPTIGMFRIRDTVV